MKGVCKEVELKSGRQLHYFAPQVPQEKRGRRHMGKQLKIPAESAQEKREYAKKYVNMKGRMNVSNAVG